MALIVHRTQAVCFCPVRSRPQIAARPLNTIDALKLLS